MSFGCSLHGSVLSKLSPPTSFSKVYKDECTLCYATPDDEFGLDICLSCFNGSCMEHSAIHFRKSAHSLVLNIKRNMKEEVQGEQQPNKISRLEIKEERCPPEYHYSYIVRCLGCGLVWDMKDDEIKPAHTTINAIISSLSAEKKLNVQSWREEVVFCEHVTNLQQEVNSVLLRLQPRDCCGKCEMKENLWLCLTCGSVGCGRKQYDGSGGNGHGAVHFQSSHHPVALKLGTITPEGNADVFCYICDEMRVDPSLSSHLSTFGIDVAAVEKTEQTMAELQLEQNLKFDFSMVTDDGKQLVPINGPGMTGLKNLGNSCYMSSVIQPLFHLDSFRHRYFNDGSRHVEGCQKDPAACFICQATKLATGIWDGAHKQISPWMFKSVTSLGHSEFSTNRQQDASEFFSYLLKIIQRSDPTSINEIVEPFTFGQQQELKCSSCGDTRIQNHKSTQLCLNLSDVLSSSTEDIKLSDKLELVQFFESFFAEEIVESKCSKCAHSEKIKFTRFTSLPEYLVISLNRYIIRNWVPHKIDMSISIPFTDIDLNGYVTKTKSITKSSPIVDQETLNELLSMGFSNAKSKKAILETGNMGVEAAMNWILEHEDLTIPEEDPPKTSNPNNLFSDEIISSLMDAGFNRKHAIQALQATDGDIERAFDWILSHPEESIPDPSSSFPEEGSKSDNSKQTTGLYDLISFISHKGPSVHCGHYISHVKNTLTGEWIMFNDERVVIADPQPPIPASEKAYIYIFKLRPN